MFASWYSQGAPAQFHLNGVIHGLDEALQLMVAGEKRRIWIPEELAYQAQPQGQQGMLVFDVELVRLGGDGAMPIPPKAFAGNPCHWAFDACLANKTDSATCGATFSKCLGLAP